MELDGKSKVIMSFHQGRNNNKQVFYGREKVSEKLSCIVVVALIDAWKDKMKLEFGSEMQSLFWEGESGECLGFQVDATHRQVMCLPDLNLANRVATLLLIL